MRPTIFPTMKNMSKHTGRLRPLMISACMAATMLGSGSINAQETESSAGPAALPTEIEANLAESRDTILKRRDSITELEARVASSEGLARQVLETRLDKAWIQLLEDNLSFADEVATQEEAGYDIAVYREEATRILGLQLGIARSGADRIRTRITLPDRDLSAAEQAASDTKVFDAVQSLNRIYEVLMSSLELSVAFGLEVSSEETVLKESLAERAANYSILLELSTDEVVAIRAGVAALSDDAELNARLIVAEDRVQKIATVLESVVAMMTAVGMDASVYTEQVLVATGEITTDALDVKVIGALFSRWGERLMDTLVEEGPRVILQLVLFVVIVLGFLKLAKLTQRFVNRGLDSSKIHLSQLLRKMIVSTSRNLVIILGVLIALSQLGISLGPLLAGLGIAGFVIGFALQDSLSNFASGMMILIYRPFDVGDIVEAGTVFGTVSHMSMVNTTILTIDNQTLVVPNNKIWGDVIKNVTAQSTRRVDLVFGISYSDDIPLAERVLKDIVESHEMVLEDPEPMIKLHELGDSSVNFVVRPWVKTDNYWDVYWDVMRAVKLRFDKEGISIPFPQRDVHLFTEDA